MQSNHPIFIATTGGAILAPLAPLQTARKPPVQAILFELFRPSERSPFLRSVDVFHPPALELLNSKAVSL